MLIRLTRLTNDRHRFEVVRDDGTREAHELETRSTLAHDLAHYAVELEGGLSRSFYGRLACGLRYAELTAAPPEGPEALQTERVVAMLQGYLAERRSRQPRSATDVVEDRFELRRDWRRVPGLAHSRFDRPGARAVAARARPMACHAVSRNARIGVPLTRVGAADGATIPTALRSRRRPRSR